MGTDQNKAEVAERPYAPRPTKRRYAQEDAAIRADKAIIRYFSNIASRRRNNGYVSESTQDKTLTAVRKLAQYINATVSESFVTELIRQYETKDKEYRYRFLDTIQDFSNAQPLISHRGYATYIKGIFRANRARLEVFVDNHFSHKTQRISEGLLEQIFQTLDRQTILAYQLLQYGAERRRALCTTPFEQWHEESDHWIISFKPQQVKTRIPHISIVPKAVGDKIIEYAKSRGRTAPFPNHNSIFDTATRFIEQRFNARLTAHYFRKRFTTIASTTPMPPNDWDYLCGSKMQVGHEADTYQLEDNSRIIAEYAQYLEPLLAINAKPYANASELQKLKRRLRKMQQTIDSQQTTIETLTQLLKAAPTTTSMVDPN